MPRAPQAGGDGATTAIVSGAQADQTIKAGKGKWTLLRVWAAGAASSKAEIYDGTVSGGTKIDEVPCTAVITEKRNLYFGSGLHVKTTDSGGTVRITVGYV